MSSDIDTRVTPSFHPDTVRSIDEYDDDTATILSSTEAAFSEAYVGIGRVHDAREAANTNPSWTEGQQIIETQNFADKVFVNVAKRFDGASAQLQLVIQGLERDLSQPIEGKGVHAVAGEIRTYVRGLEAGKQIDFIRNAIMAGDERTVGACLGAPAYLAGITPEMQTVLLRMYHERAHPHDAKKLKAARAGLDLIGKRSGLIFAEMEKAVGAPPQKVKALRDAKAKAERRFVV